MSSDEEEAPGQAEYNLGGAALSAAFGAVARDAALAGEAPADAGTLAAARERARQMLAEAGDADADGLRDMHNLTLSIGLPATRALFRQAVCARQVRGAAKAAALREIDEFSPVTEVGCLKADFFNQVTRQPDAAYLLLDECPKDHDLGAQIAKIWPLILPAKWPEVLRHLSMLIFFGRSVFANTARQHLPLVRSLFGLPAGAPCDPFLALQVDPVNTTLFLDAGWPLRVGIFVRLEAEVEAGAGAGAATGAATG